MGPLYLYFGVRETASDTHLAFMASSPPRAAWGVTIDVTMATDGPGTRRTAVDAILPLTCDNGLPRPATDGAVTAENRGVGSPILPLDTHRC
jgi:hypothetical protein